MYLSVIICERKCNINKFENFKYLVIISKILAFLAAYFGKNKEAQASFDDYITFFRMCTGLIFHGKKGNGSYLFGLSKKLTFLEIDTSDGNGKGQDSNGKGQMSHPFCPLPLTVQDKNIINMNVQ